MKILATASIIALSAAPVFAGSLEEPVIAPEPVTPIVPVATPSLWSGGYIGAQAGYGWAESGDDEGEGAVGGVHAGYLMNSGKFVYGGEAEYNYSDVELDDDAGSIDDISRLKLKAGYDLGRTLVYATAGAAYANADVNGDSGSDWGWTAGAGVDYMLTDTVSVGGEVSYDKFDDFDGSGADIEDTTLAAKVSYHF